MKITIEGTFGDDFPTQMRDAAGFAESIILQTRRKLGLRQQDEVIVKVICNAKMREL
jgi:hypothetical protein